MSVDFVTRFHAAPVTARSNSLDILEFVIVEFRKVESNGLCEMLFSKIVHAAGLNLEEGVAPGLYVDGEWVEMWNYVGADEGEGDGALG
jgi:hypothetical protein